MFDNAPIGVKDKNGKPVHNGDTIKNTLPGYEYEYRVIYDQETCSFKLRRLNVPFNHCESILDYLIRRFYVVAHHVVEGGE